MARAGTALVVAVAAVGAACMGHRSQGAQAGAQTQTQTPPAGERGMAMMQDCPMAVPGTQVSAADTDDGEAITFTTSAPDQVQALRDRVHAMAAMHDRHMEARAGMQGDAQGGSMQGGTGAEGSAGSGDGSKQPGEAQDQGMGMGPGMGMHRMPASRTTVEDVDGGARVTVAALDPADADQVRSAIRTHVDHMQQTGSCGMGGMPQQPLQQQ